MKANHEMENLIKERNKYIRFIVCVFLLIAFSYIISLFAPFIIAAKRNIDILFSFKVQLSCILLIINITFCLSIAFGAFKRKEWVKFPIILFYITGTIYLPFERFFKINLYHQLLGLKSSDSTWLLVFIFWLVGYPYLVMLPYLRKSKAG
jgi:hypothetical protein